MILRFHTHLPVSEIGDTPDLVSFFSESLAQPEQLTWNVVDSHPAVPAPIPVEETLIERIQSKRRSRRK